MKPRVSALLVTSLAASGVSLLLPTAFGPFGPLGAGLLAFLGYRRVRASGGSLRGPLLARVAMSAALVVLVLMAVSMVRGARPAAALRGMATSMSAVERVLRDGTAEQAWDLLSPEGRVGRERTAFVASLRASMLRLGPLEAMLDERHPGADWKRLGELAPGVELRLPIEVDARFRGGPGRILAEFRVGMAGERAVADLLRLDVEPGR